MAERSLLLQLLDQIWKDHLLSLDHLRQGINLRAYAQRDPLNEYKREAFDLFQQMLNHLREQVTSVLCHVELRVQRPEELEPRPPQHMIESREDPAEMMERERANGGEVATATAVAAAPWARTPRNAPCPCGSGKKYKHCHGRA
jgi:preprotein translocase subunit SecA